ncbi:aminodeoxychorismate/anthranilate synthase component II [Enterococcus ureilyticus]|uniref:anthranilate synthase component II n=1 Tax=Enterococcus ureilyticus TaxID=1131292 RepID=UPI001A915E17|nr:aminodeoxychorismate/anthranilate synthase component II [Enterococcus ureilyticus]MBO0444746.1 aminodeoxychorismate/anthranilate synthase component II [Enterococcus ureilyticus]
MILLIDNYDSFTYNLAQLLGVEREIKIVRNDSETIFSLANQASAIVISPGPGTPKETGQVKEVIKQFYQKKPILGICLGHQTIGEVFGAKVSRAKKIRHGKQSLIKIHQNNQLFKEVDSGNLVMRYHSLIIEQETLPEDFLITATAADDQEIMAIEHREYPIFGLQFHPESIGTPSGAVIIKNFIQQTEVK